MLATFPEPPELQEAVQFWRDIFVLFAQNQAVLHDREQLSIVWRVVSLPVSASGVVDERPVRAALEDLRRRMLRLAKAPIALDEIDAKILEVAPSPGMLRDASLRIRAQRGLADRFRIGLGRAEPHLASIERVFKERGLPADLVALSFVESSFQPRARSAAGAAGLWQLMPRTARELGLHVSRRRDDRYDMVKATVAAATLLRQNYRSLGSWPLAITAYNHGPAGIRRAVAHVGSDQLPRLIQQYRRPSWGFASKNFYAEFLAARRALAELRDPGQSEQANLGTGP
jgi:membrane-bound lytic murein transglycosylase D